MKEIIRNNIKFIITMFVLIIFGLVGITYALKLGEFTAIGANINTATINVNVTYDNAVNGAIVTSTNKMLPIDDSLVTGPSVTDERVLKVKFNVAGTSSNPANTIYDIALHDLNIDCDLRTEDLKWRLYKGSTLLSSGNLSPTFDTMADSRLVLTNTQENLTTTSTTYVFLLWISESCNGDIKNCTKEDDQSKYLNKELNGTIKIETTTKSKKALVRTTGRAGSCEYTSINTPNSLNITYNGLEQTAVPSGEGFTLTNNTATDAGKYIATAKLIEGYKWQDGSTDDKYIEYTIKQKEMTIKAANRTITYGEELNLNATQLSSNNQAVVRPLTNYSNAKAKLLDSSRESSFTTTNLISGHTVTDIKLEADRVNAGKGKIIPTKAKIVDSNNNDVTSNYKIIYKSGTLTINKANCTCEIVNSAPFEYEIESTETISYNCTGDGNIEVISEDPNSLGVVSSNNSNAKVKAKKTGNINLTITREEGKNYNACTPATSEINIFGLNYEVNFNPNNGIDTSIYQELEYIESNYVQYINTGLYANGKYYVELEGAYSEFQHNKPAFGSWTSYDPDYDYLINTTMVNGEEKLIMAAGYDNSTYYSFYDFDLNRHLFSIRGSGIYIDNNLINSNVALNYPVESPIIVFAAAADYTVHDWYAASFKLYSLVMTSSSNGQIVRDYIPVKRKSDGTLGLYDRANNIFYTNSGTGTFIEGSELPTTITATENKPMPNISNVKPINYGYEFIGWYDNPDYKKGTKYYNSDGTSVRKYNKNKGTTLYAGWEGAPFNITFDSLGGTINTTSSAIKYNTKYGTLPTTSKTKHTFNGWYANLAKAVTFLDESGIVVATGEQSVFSGYASTAELIPVTGGTTLYSNKSICGIYSYDANGNYIKRESSYAMTHTISANAAYIRIELNKNSQSLNDYLSDLIITEDPDLFALSYIQNEITSETIMTSSKDHKLYAKLSPNEYTVTFNPNSGSVSPTTKKVLYNSIYGQLPTPTRTGYDFLGWNGKNYWNLDNCTQDYATISGNTVTLDATSVSSNTGQTLYIQTYLNGSFVSNATSFTSTGTNSYTFTKSSAFDTLKIKVNTSKADPAISLNVGSLTNGNTYTLSFNIISLSNAYAVIENIQLESGSTASQFEPYYVTGSTKFPSATNRTLKARWKTKSITCSAGEYLSANSVSCSSCTSGNYCTGGTYNYSSSTQGISSCDSGYTSGESATARTSCYKTLTATFNYSNLPWTSKSDDSRTCDLYYNNSTCLVTSPSLSSYNISGTNLAGQNLSNYLTLTWRKSGSSTNYSPGSQISISSNTRINATALLNKTNFITNSEGTDINVRESATTSSNDPRSINRYYNITGSDWGYPSDPSADTCTNHLWIKIATTTNCLHNHINYPTSDCVGKYICAYYTKY